MPPAPLRIIDLERDPIHQLRFSNASKRGGVESQLLPILAGRASGLPPEVDGLVLTSDLQGVVPSYARGGQNVLLGVELVEVLLALSDERLIPEPSGLGVVLAGDLFSAPGGDVRGATGDVRAVWEAFAASFRWVAGVAGNHDQFGSDKEQRRLASREGVELLDGRVARLDELPVGGVGYIMGHPAKVGRRSEQDFMAALSLTLEQAPSLLVLHQGPDGVGRRQRGSELVRELLELAPPDLVVCGHVHWDDPLAELTHEAQVVNVDGRVIVLTRA